MTVNEMLAELASQMAEISGNPRAQFGPKNRKLLGATILPERLVDSNMYTEESVSYRTVVAADGTRYSPAQKRGNALVGTLKVELLESDVADELVSQEYQAIQKLLGRGDTMEAQARFTRFMDRLIASLVEKNEVRTWQALVDAQIVREGDGGSETINLINPAGHRADAALAWEDEAADAIADIVERAGVLAAKGYTVGRIIGTTPLLARLRSNAKVKEYVGSALVTNAQINALLEAYGLPAIEVYDALYRTQTGTERFLRADALVFLAETGRDADVDLGDEQVIIPNTLGYTGIGVAAGQAEPGRAVHTEHFTNKPPRVEGEAWQTSGPVVLDPEAVAVLTVPAAA